jgi:hypothetical protein
MAAGRKPFDGSAEHPLGKFGKKHRTLNAQHPTSNNLRSSDWETFDVQRSMLDVRCYHLYFAGCSLTQSPFSMSMRPYFIGVTRPPGYSA